MSKYLFSGGLRKVSNGFMFSYSDTKTEKGPHHTYSWPRVLVLFAFLWLHKLQNTFDARTAHRYYIYIYIFYPKVCYEAPIVSEP